jgi:hypothetical protein
MNIIRNFFKQIKKMHNHYYIEQYWWVDFLLELREELSIRILNRNYPPGFDSLYYYGLKL